ncbi:MAG: hypothetical protein ACE5IQ_06895 [Candidatus Methylomirabilales bacterium]
MVAWSLVASVVGLAGTAALVAVMRRQRPQWGPERYWVLGMAALFPAWLIAFLGSIAPPGGEFASKPLFIFSSALPLLGAIATDALLRRQRNTGHPWRPLGSWVLGLVAILPGWIVALLAASLAPPR